MLRGLCSFQNVSADRCTEIAFAQLYQMSQPAENMPVQEIALVSSEAQRMQLSFSLFGRNVMARKHADPDGNAIVLLSGSKLWAVSGGVQDRNRIQEAADSSES